MRTLRQLDETNMYKNIATYKTKNTKTPFCREREREAACFCCARRHLGFPVCPVHLTQITSTQVTELALYDVTESCPVQFLSHSSVVSLVNLQVFNIKTLLCWANVTLLAK